jgi:DNA-binding response OmpR family regulator
LGITSKVKSVVSTVLIVEDDPNTIEIIKLYLGRDGHNVITSHDGLEGLRLARDASPDLVVLDLMLPGMDGMPHTERRLSDANRDAYRPR